MIYQITDEITEIDIEQINPDILTVGLISLGHLKANIERLGFSQSTVTACESQIKTIRSTIDTYDDYCFGILNVVNVNDVLGSTDKIGFYIRNNLFLMVDILDEDDSTGAVFSTAVKKYPPKTATLERLIFTVFDRLLYDDNSALEKIEFSINEVECNIAKGDISQQVNQFILQTKRKLLILRNYYEQLIDIGEELIDNELEMFGKKGNMYFKLFTEKVSRLSSNVQVLRESLAQAREAYQAEIDHSLNKTMKLFTVMTAIFLPLTLITGWYGMNFANMPELNWKYGYLLCAVFSAIVAAVCIWIFKKKKYF